VVDTGVDCCELRVAKLGTLPELPNRNFIEVFASKYTHCSLKLGTICLLNNIIETENLNFLFSLD